MPSQSERSSPRFRRKEKGTSSEKNGAQTSTPVEKNLKSARKMISMTGEVSSASPDLTDLRKRQSHGLAPPSSFEALVSPPRRLRNSIAVTPKIPSFASPGQAASLFRKKKSRARYPAPPPPETFYESSPSPDGRKEGRKVEGNASNDDFPSSDTCGLEDVEEAEKVSVAEKVEESSFHQRMHCSISSPPLMNSPESPSSGRGRKAKNSDSEQQAAMMKRSLSPPPLSPEVDSNLPERGRKLKVLAPDLPLTFRKTTSGSSSRSVSRSISPSVSRSSRSESPSVSPDGRKAQSMAANFFSSLSSPTGAGAEFRRRESVSSGPPPSFKHLVSPESMRGRKSIAVPDGLSSVSGHGGPGATFRKRESMSPGAPPSFRAAALSPGSLRGRRSVAVPGGLLSASSHDGPDGSSRGRRSVVVPDGLSSVSSHDGPGAKFRRRESLSESPASIAARGGFLLSVSSHDGPGASPGAMSPGSLRGRRSIAVSGGLLSTSSHDRPGAVSPGSLRGRRSVGVQGSLLSASSHDGPGATSPGSLQGRRSVAVSGALSSRENSISPSVSPERWKPKSMSTFLSPGSDQGGIKEGFGQRGSQHNSSKGLTTPPSSRRSFAVPGDLSSLSAHGPRRTRQSIAIIGNLSSLSSHDGGGSLNALVTPTQLGRKGLGMINEKEIPSFASPRGQKMQASKKWTSTYLDKPMGGPRGAVKKNKKEMSPVALGQLSGSYMEKSPGGFNSRVSMSPGSLSRLSISKMAMVMPQNLDDTPEDISIQVTIPDIELKILARKEQQKKALEYSVPEHIRKYREREERVKTAAEEKEYQQRELAIAYIYGWAARTRYKNMRRERDKKLAKIAKEKSAMELRYRSALRVQTRYRMYVKRKRYLHLIDCRRRRAKNSKQIKKIEKRLAKIPKEASAELKTLKKEHLKKKKEMKREMKKLKVTDAEQQNQNLIEYLREENRKLRELRQSMQADHSLLQKQFGMLDTKSAEIDKRFNSLKKFVAHKNESLQKTETVLQKCRHKYLPNHRKELANRNLHCVIEMRIKDLYQKRLDRILDEVSTVAKERELRKDAKRATREVNRELSKLPVLEKPADLIELLEELDWTRKYS
ncbi:unnamed protein product [Cylindrotheca closterium]|uniref:Uncharacterized protein n=1 Tax=Cylindrotheca closterium TaxID=2856 RepID=A0AAD2FYF2_9STRA|nr:unnamed protein product [Cylindrotheca closterium]